MPLAFPTARARFRSMVEPDKVRLRRTVRLDKLDPVLSFDDTLYEESAQYALDNTDGSLVGGTSISVKRATHALDPDRVLPPIIIEDILKQLVHALIFTSALDNRCRADDLLDAAWKSTGLRLPAKCRWVHEWIRQEFGSLADLCKSYPRIFLVAPGFKVITAVSEDFTKLYQFDASKLEHILQAHQAGTLLSCLGEPKPAAKPIVDWRFALVPPDDIREFRAEDERLARLSTINQEMEPIDQHKQAATDDKAAEVQRERENLNYLMSQRRSY
eukprot:gene2758-3387_t